MLTVELRAVSALKANPENARTHPKKQIRKLERSIQEFGYFSPLLVDENNTIIAGHGRLCAAQRLAWEMIPVFVLSGLSATQKRALALADNKIPADAGWNHEVLARELGELALLDDFDISLSGFEPAEVDQLLFDHEARSDDPADELPASLNRTASARGDLWKLGEHRLLCGDARLSEDIACLCEDRRASAAFLDPPYNVRVAGIVGRGRRKHDEFAMASGEMSAAEFQKFLTLTLRNGSAVSLCGAVHFVCMDWRHIADLLAAGDAVYPVMLNLVVWNKTNAGQGSFYRSQHELIAVFRVGEDSHLNNIELGRYGRSRSNVWTYAGVNSFGPERDNLAAHPTVKPVSLVADAIKDCTRRHDYVLDLFGGAGTTLLAAERVGRRALVLEYEPKFVDVTIRRWQRYAGQDAVHAESGRTFDDIAAGNDLE
jgi:DNA modification methylase